MAVEIMYRTAMVREDRRRISVRLCALETSRGSPCHARERGQARLLFLPPSDLNPIEMAFAKLKAHLRAVAMRTIDELWKAIGQHLRPLHPAECASYFAAVEYRIQ